MKRNDKPLLTIGMATIDDFDGTYFTVTSLLVHHAEAMRDCEIVVVDNRPDAPQGKLLADWMRTSVPIGRYVAFDGPPGTAQPRNEVFRRARGAAVLCLDCHVLLAPGAVRKLIDYYRRNPSCRDLLCGPLLNDAGQLSATHQRPQWSRGAWGVWSIDPRGNDPDGKPFEIWQQGMGLFSCRKEAWVGFHPEFRGFGGCESYVMEKFRRRGGRVLCCPWLRWTHRFPRAHGVPYPVNEPDRVHNYVVGFRELGLDTRPVLEHFNGKSGAQESPKRQASRAAEFAVVGDSAYGGVTMRGRALAEHLGCKLIAPRQVAGMVHRRTIVAIKTGFDARTIRAKCDRLVYDPLDAFCDLKTNVDPVEYWRAKYDELRFDDILATSPACRDVMRAALPAQVGVYLVPHPCDARIDAGWRNPAGPIVYAGLRQFIASGEDRIRRACRMIGRDFVVGPTCDVLRGAALALALRLPPFDNELNRLCKPQIKLENAAAAGLPVVATDCPAALSLHPGVTRVSADFTAAELAEALQRALAGPPLSSPFDNRQFLAAMDRVLRKEKLVVYTAIFGGYDVLRDPRERLPGVEYVCFSDNPRLKSNVWQIRYCGPTDDPARDAKRLKILSHEALDCDTSLWIDGRIELHGLRPALDSLRTDLALLKHPRRNCIYDEADHCRRIGRGDPRRIAEAVARYRAQGHPAGYGLWMGGILLRRHTAATAAFNREWWSEISTGTSRDQISLPVVLRRSRIGFETLRDDLIRHRIHEHVK